MTISTKTIFKWLTLILVAILSMMLWRWENTHHGWDGLIWIGYHHYAVYAGCLVFILWANLVLNLKPSQRLALNIGGIVYSVLTYFVFATVYSLAFGRVMGPTWLLWLFFTSQFWIYPLWLLGAKLLFALAGLKVSWRWFATALAILVLGFFSAPILIDVFHLHRFGYDDLIHLVKTGAIIPAVVISMGVMVLGGKKIEAKEYPIDSNSGILDAPSNP